MPIIVIGAIKKRGVRKIDHIHDYKMNQRAKLSIHPL